MTISIGQLIGKQNSTLTSAAPSASATFTVNPAPGSALFVPVTITQGAGASVDITTTVDDNQLANPGYTEDEKQTYTVTNANDTKVSLYRLPTVGAISPATFTVTLSLTNPISGATYTATWGVVEVKGLVANPLDQFATSGQLSGVQSATAGPTGKLAVNDEIALGVWSNSSGSSDTVTTPAGSANVWLETNGAANFEGNGCYRVFTAADPVSMKWTTTAAAGGLVMAGIVVTYKGAPISSSSPSSASSASSVAPASSAAPATGASALSPPSSPSSLVGAAASLALAQLRSSLSSGISTTPSGAVVIAPSPSPSLVASSSSPSSSLVALRTYYVSPGGNDNNNGTSQSTPWKTVGKVNGWAKLPGDAYYFQRDQTFSGNLTLFTSGTALAPIVYGSYGPGADAIIDSGTTDVDTFNVANCSWITIQNLQFHSGAVASNGAIDTAHFPTTSLSSGLKFQADGTGSRFTGIQVSNVKVNGAYFAGIYFHSTNATNSASGYDSCSLTNCTVTNTSWFGIDMDYTGNLATNIHTNISWVNCTQSFSWGDARVTTAATGFGTVPQNCTSFYGTGLLSHDNGQNNSWTGAGTAGLLFFQCLNGLISGSETYNNFDPANGDGDGLDIDCGNTGCVFHGCYTHDNSGTGMLFGGKPGTVGDSFNCTYRFCVSVNNGLGQSGNAQNGMTGEVAFFGTSAGSITYHNCTIARDPANGTNNAPMIFNGLTAGSITVNWYNNLIFLNHVNNGQEYANVTGTLNSDGNLYWRPGNTTNSGRISYNGTAYGGIAAYSAATGHDGSGVQADPKLVNAFDHSTFLPSQGVTQQRAYDLLAGSAAIDSGVLLSSVGITYSGGDFHNTPVRPRGLDGIGAVVYAPSSSLSASITPTPHFPKQSPASPSPSSSLSSRSSALSSALVISSVISAAPVALSSPSSSSPLVASLAPSVAPGPQSSPSSPVSSSPSGGPAGPAVSPAASPSPAVSPSPSVAPVAVTSSSSSAPSSSSSAAALVVIVNPIPPLPSGVVGQFYSITFTATGGTPPYTFTALTALPPGLTLSSTGVLSGTPTQAGTTSPIVIQATDSQGNFGQQAYSLLVLALFGSSSSTSAFAPVITSAPSSSKAPVVLPVCSNFSISLSSGPVGYVQLPSPAVKGGAFSISTWVRINAKRSSQYLYSQGAVGLDNLSLASFTGNLSFFSGSLSTPDPGPVLADFKWHLAGVTWDGGTATLWLDGKVLNSTSSGSPDFSGALANIGSPVASNFALQGKLDDFRVYPFVLSAAQWSGLFVGQQVLGLSHYWPFEEGPGSKTTADLVGGLTGTLQGSAFFSTDVPNPIACVPVFPSSSSSSPSLSSQAALLSSVAPSVLSSAQVSASPAPASKILSSSLSTASVGVTSPSVGAPPSSVAPSSASPAAPSSAAATSPSPVSSAALASSSLVTSSLVSAPVVSSAPSSPARSVISSAALSSAPPSSPPSGVSSSPLPASSVSPSSVAPVPPIPPSLGRVVLISAEFFTTIIDAADLQRNRPVIVNF